MKCDLCREEKSNQGLLCQVCGDTIKRLLAIQERLQSPKTCEAARLARAAEADCASCDGVGACSKPPDC